MMNLDLNEIEDRLAKKKLSRYYGCNSTYSAKYIKRSDIPDKFKDIPLYEVDLLKEGITVSHNLDCDDRYCFGTYLNYGKRGIKNYRHLVSVYIKFKPEERDEHLNNYLWMSKDQLQEHINYLRDSLGFDFFFRIIEAGDWYIVQFDFKRMSKLKIKYALFWTRYSYEFPSSMCMIDAYLLKERHPEEQLHNLLRIPQRAISQTSFCVREDQSISIFGLFLDKETFMKRISRSNLSVCNIYMNSKSSNDIPFIWNTNIDNIFHGNFVKFENWLRSNDRFKTYERLLVWYKKHPFKNKTKVDPE